MNKALYQVKVTNDNDFELEDRYDGILYKFPAGKTVNIPYYAACHIFGVEFFGSDGSPMDNRDDVMFRHLQRRWGWNIRRDGDKGLTAFKNLSFKVVAMSMVETIVEDDENAEPELGDPRSKKKFLNIKSKNSSEGAM